MNKYQDALDNLVYCKSELKCPTCKHKNLCTMERDSNILQELVDKETPMKVDKKDIKKIYCDKFLITLVAYHKCPNKKCEFHNNYKILVDEKRCPECGQKLYWGDESE